eukprot:2384913-Rhodomonas_salina.1
MLRLRHATRYPALGYRGNSWGEGSVLSLGAGVVEPAMGVGSVLSSEAMPPAQGGYEVGHDRTRGGKDRY